MKQKRTLVKAKDVLEVVRSEKVAIQGGLEKKMELDMNRTKAKEETRQVVMDRFIGENKKNVEIHAVNDSQLSECQATSLWIETYQLYQQHSLPHYKDHR